MHTLQVLVLLVHVPGPDFRYVFHLTTSHRERTATNGSTTCTSTVSSTSNMHVYLLKMLIQVKCTLTRTRDCRYLYVPIFILHMHEYIIVYKLPSTVSTSVCTSSMNFKCELVFASKMSIYDSLFFDGYFLVSICDTLVFYLVYAPGVKASLFQLCLLFLSKNF